MLSILSTPIGNLGDITLRALATLKQCDGIVCEDTRVTGHLLSLLTLPKKPLYSLHGYSNQRTVEGLIERLSRNEHLCLTSDAGTPCISDPGYALVKRAREEGLALEVVPGASAFLAGLSLSGLPIHQFTYLGFLPIKKGRKTLIASLEHEERTIVFYESPHRILKTLHELSEHLHHQPARPIVIGRELTKAHEEVISTTIGALPEATTSLTVKGEFVIILGCDQNRVQRASLGNDRKVATPD